MTSKICLQGRKGHRSGSIWGIATALIAAAALFAPVPADAAIGASLVTSIADNADLSSYAFPSATYSNNVLYIAFTATTCASGAACEGVTGAPTVTSLSGAGLTFTEIGTAGGVDYAGSPVGDRRIQAWHAFVTSGAGTGVVTATLSGQSNSMGAVILAFTGTKTTGVNGADAIANYATNTGSGTSLQVNMAPFADSNNRPVAFFTHRASEATTHETGYTNLWDGTTTSLLMGHMAEWHATTAETTPSASWVTSASAGGFAVEIASAGSGPIAHWTFDEGSGTIAADSVGTNDGTLTNGPTWTCVAGGYALNFDGTNDEVSLPGPVVGDRAAWTVTAWIKMGADTADQRTIYSEGDTSADEYWFLYVDDTTDKVKFWSPNGSFTMTGITPVEDNAWHLVTMVQRSKTERELYVGTVSQAIDNTNMGTLTYNTASIGFLRANGWTADPFKGLIDDVRIYDHALTPAEISALAASPPGACGGNTTTIADGTDPGNVTIAPGGAITDLDAFTLVASSGTDTVTAATVTLGPAGAFNNIGQADITNASNVAQCTAITNPGSNTLSFTGCTIPVTTTPTTFKVRITPKTHASMPAVPGASYAVTGTVTAFTSTNTQAGTDTNSATVTIDNLSPSNVTGAGATPGDTQVTVSWTNPGGDFSNVVVLRNTATISDVPTEGSSPAIDSTIGTSVVRYIASGTSFIDTGLTNGQIYYYRIFAKDTNGNYAATGVEVSATPAAGSGTTLEVRVSASSDDAEECLNSNAMYLDSSDLELIHDIDDCGGLNVGAGDQQIGMRFLNMTIPKGATITKAYIEFETDETSSVTTNVTFWGQAADNPGTFISTTNDITSRAKTTASVAWNNVPAWNTVDEKHQTPDLSPIIQEIVNRSGWTSGNAIVVMVTGDPNSERYAESYDGEPANAPLLHVEYTTGNTTTIGDATAPANKSVAPSSTNNAVDAFTLSTDTGTDTVTTLTVTFTGTDVTDVAASGVKIYQDNGGTANEWDAGDTLIGTASFSGSTASFTGLNISVNTTATQYLVTYDIAAGATASNTLQGAITAATVTNTLVNNDTTDATLTVSAGTPDLQQVHYRWRNDDGGEAGGGAITHQETLTGSGAATNTVTVTNVGSGADQLYLTAVAIYGTNMAVSSMSGGGLTWTLQKRQCAARISQPWVEVWQAFGSPGAPFSVTVNLDGTADRVSAHVSRYSGADPTTPTEGADGSNTVGQGASAVCDPAGIDNDTMILTLASSSNNSVLYVASHTRNNSIATPDPDYTERAFITNSSGGDGANLYVHDRTLATAGSDTITHILGAAKPWDMAGLVIRPSGSGASWAAAEDTALTGLAKNTTKRLRIEISNAGAASGSVLYRLEVSPPNPASCDAATYTRVDTSADWTMVTSTYFADGDPTANISPGMTDAPGKTFAAGQLKESTDQTSGITLSGTEFTEIEYAVQATASATDGATYCFRLTDAGTATNFTYTEANYGKVTLAGTVAPTVTNVTPPSGPTAGGTVVTITGTNFDSGVTDVKFGTTPATGVTFITSTQIIATTPTHAAGLVDVTVTNPDTQSGTLIDAYTYGPPPTVTSVSPPSGIDTGGTAVTITGTDFVDGATVTFGGTAAIGVTFVSSTKITATTPAHAAGFVNVTVTNPDTQSGTLPNGFEYVSITTTVVESRVSASSDDAEEPASGGTPDLTSSDLELTEESSNQQIGMRFLNMTIPKGVVITYAYIEFETDETSSMTKNLTFWGQAADNPGTFTSTTNDITSRAKTTASVDWNNVPAWNTVSEKHQTPDLSPIIQEIIDRSGWASGNAMVVMVTDPGTGKRVAESYDGEPANAPLLHVEYVYPAPTVTNIAPTSGPTAGGTAVTIAGTNFVDGATVTLGGAAATGVTFVSSTQITATTPAHVAGVVDVLVTNPDFQSGILSNGYMYTDSPCDANICWDGGGTTNNWSEGANWAGDVVPGAGDIAVFGDLSSKNAVIDVPITINGLIIDTLYTGSVAQSSGMTMTIGSAGYDQKAGTFLGANTTIDINGPSTLSGGTLTSTSGTMSVQNNFTVSGGTFNHNSGNVTFDGGNKTVNASTAVFNNVTLNQGASDLTVTGTMVVDGNLTITSVSNIDGTISVARDVTSTDTSVTGTGPILLDGTGNQVLSASGGTGELPSVTINKSSGTLTIQDTIEISGNWTYTAGTVNAGTSTIVFTTNGQTVASGSMSFNNVTVNNGGSSLTVTGTMDVNGNLALTSLSAINGGTVAVEGNVTSTDSSVTGTGTILFDGAGAQTLGASGGTGELPNVTIDKSSGTLTIQDTIKVSGNWTYTAGTVNAGTSAVVFTTGGQTIDAGSMSFNHVTFDTGGSSTITGAMDVNGTLTILNVVSLEGGTIAVAGNLTSTDASVGGTASITLDGTADQTIAVQDISNGTFIINKASGTATLINDLILNSGQALNISAGTLDQGSGLDLTAGSITLAADTTWKNLSGSTSTITIGSGGVSNSGTINFNSSTGGCGEADAIRVRSTSGGVSRPWSGIGAYVLIDVDVQDQAGTAAITVFNGTDTGNNGSNWTFNDCDSAPTVIIIDWREVY